MTPNPNGPGLSPGLLLGVGYVSLGLIVMAAFNFVMGDAKLTQVGVAILVSFLMSFVADRAAKRRDYKGAVRLNGSIALGVLAVALIITVYAIAVISSLSNYTYTQ